MVLTIYIAQYLLYTKSREKSREMNDNNKKNQNNGLNIPERQLQSAFLNNRNRAAIEFRRQKVQQLYQKANTEQIAEIQQSKKEARPERINLAEYLKNQNNSKKVDKRREELIKNSIEEVSKPFQPQPKASFNFGVGQETDEFKTRQKVIQPLQNKQDIVKVDEKSHN